jgi:hypothetical protein
VGADLLANITQLSDANQVDGAIIAPTPVQLLTDITAAYKVLSDQYPGTSINLAGPKTVTPGVYAVLAGQTLSGTITLDGAGVYIFGSDSAYTVANSAKVLLTNGATACNVFWQIPTAMTIGTSVEMVGTIITNSEAITLNTSATLQGRAFSRIAAVTLDTNQITTPSCAALGGHQSPSVSVFTPPSINITKIPTPLALPSGPGPVTYDYTVLNVGTVPMSNVTVTDNKCTPASFISGDTNNDLKLDTTEVWKYRCTTTLSTTTTNTVIATGQNSGNIATDLAEAIVVVGAPVVPPLIHLVKVPNKFVLPAGGGAVTYSYSVTNPGTVPLSDVTITDDKCTGLPGRVVGHPGDLNKNNLLDSNETWQFTCQTNLTKTTTNIGTATGHANGFTVTDISPATVVVAPTIPKLPNTGLPPEGTIPSSVALVSGIVAVITCLYFARRKQTT